MENKNNSFSFTYETSYSLQDKEIKVVSSCIEIYNLSEKRKIKLESI